MRPLVYDVSRGFLLAALKGLFPGEAAGLRHVPPRGSGGFIVASNHASFLDPPVVGVELPHRFAFFARKTLWKPGLASWWLDAVGTIPVDRDGGSDVAALKRTLKALAEGRPVILFPEGTRTEDGRLGEPRAGVGLIACRSGVPVVPARVFGTRKAYGRGVRVPRVCVPVDVVYGRPLAPSEYDPGTGKDRYEQAAARIMAAIAALRRPGACVV